MAGQRGEGAAIAWRGVVRHVGTHLRRPRNAGYGVLSIISHTCSMGLLCPWAMYCLTALACEPPHVEPLDP